jgi:hypothetical protein
MGALCGRAEGPFQSRLVGDATRLDELDESVRHGYSIYPRPGSILT